ncbi:MAG: thioredoxin-dependent thiol peroxidase [Alteromonadaceae bacterium]|nr:MAG: thioredoxin-dependent thiol peroxidase [Alteromonadaceae bacterium]
MTFPKIGNKAPKFSLKNQDDQDVSLEAFRDQKNVVIYFYPKAMTPGCIVQACGIRDSNAVFDELDAVVLGVSPDPVAKLKRFEDKQSLNFDLLSDEGHLLADKYGVWGLKKFMGREFMGILRTTFIVDKNGALRHIIDKVKTKTHHDQVVALLDLLPV